MPEYLGFTLWMEVDGVKLDEYKVEHDESSNTVTCWVPCQSGKEFRIGLRAPDLPRQHNYTLSFKMDGRRVELIRRKMIRMGDLDLEPRYYEGQYDEESGVVRPFQFAPLKHTDDDTYLGDFKDGLGNVVVSLYTFETLVRDHGGHPNRSEAMKPLEGAVVHERAKARLASCIAFGQPRLSPSQSPLQEVEQRDPRRNKVYSGAERIGLFVFKYRDMDILIAEGTAPPPVLLPRTPTPAPEPRQDISKRSGTRGVSRTASSSTRVDVTPNIKEEEDAGKAEGSEDDELDDQLRELKARAAALEELCNLKILHSNYFVLYAFGYVTLEGLNAFWRLKRCRVAGRHLPRVLKDHAGQAAFDLAPVGPEPRRSTRIRPRASPAGLERSISAMPEVWGISIWLEIDGNRLEEFGVQHNEEAKTVTCWVPCQTGKEFRFGVHMVQAAPRPLHYRIGLSLDGKVITSSSALPRRTIRKAAECTASKPRYFEGQQEERGLRPFQFASVKLTDDESHMTDVSKLGDLVAIVSAYEDVEVEKVPKSSRKAARVETPISLGDAVVHETAKKGLTSCIQFGELRGLPSTVRTSKAKPKAIGNREIGRIVFKYRQMDILIADGIAPRPASAPTQNPHQQASSSKSARRTTTPRLADKSRQSVKEETIDLSLDDDDDHKDETELQRLRARMAVLQEIQDLNAQIEALESKKRSRHGEGSSRAAKRVKKEVKVEHFVPGEVIDLT